MFDYKKIAVIGCCGAGKSVFSRKLAAATELPMYHLDMLYWREDCTHITRKEFIEKQNEILKNDSWIIDGNYRNTLEYRINAAQLIFFFDLPTEICLNGAINRGVRPDMPCVLPADDELRDFIINYNETIKPLVLSILSRYSDKKVIVFRSHNEADNFINNLICDL